MNNVILIANLLVQEMSPQHFAFIKNVGLQNHAA